MMEERVIALEKAIQDLKLRMVGHIPELEQPKAVEPVVEEKADAEKKEEC